MLACFAADRLSVRPRNPVVEQPTAPLVPDFLDTLQRERGNSVSARNARLAAIESFFRYLVFRCGQRRYGGSEMHGGVERLVEHRRCWSAPRAPRSLRHGPRSRKRSAGAPICRTRRGQTRRQRLPGATPGGTACHVEVEARVDPEDGRVPAMRTRSPRLRDARSFGSAPVVPVPSSRTQHHAQSACSVNGPAPVRLVRRLRTVRHRRRLRREEAVGTRSREVPHGSREPDGPARAASPG